MGRAGVGIIAVAAAVELVAGVLFMLKKLKPNPHIPYAMLSGVAFAVGGLALWPGAEYTRPPYDLTMEGASSVASLASAAPIFSGHANATASR
jgi:hypothetical protein